MEKIEVIAPAYTKKIREISCKESTVLPNRNPRVFLLADLTLLIVVVEWDWTGNSQIS